jgi:hypothetical protein
MAGIRKASNEAAPAPAMLRQHCTRSVLCSQYVLRSPVQIYLPRACSIYCERGPTSPSGLKGDVPMRHIARLLLATAAAVSIGFVWTVGQAGLAPTNRNLCDLWASLPMLPTYKACEFQNSLVYAALFAAAVLILWGLGEIIWLIRRRRKKSGPGIIHSTSAAIQLSYGEDGPFERLTKTDLSRLERQLSVEFKNPHADITITNCKLEVTYIQPFAGYRRPLVVKENFSLAGGDHVYIPFVQYGESRIGEDHIADTVVALLAPKDADPWFLAALSHDVENILTLRATAIGAAFCEERVVVWVGAGTRLRIRKYEQGDRGAFIPLEAATKEAYGVARNTDFGLAAERDEGGALTWFTRCYHEKGIPICGNVRNSTRIEPVLFRNVHIEIENEKLICKEIYGPIIWENMKVKKTDHERLLSILAGQATR